jgi:hypothetical protein
MRCLRAAVVAAISVGALVVPASGIAQIRSISIGNATLGPQGASVSLPLTVQCDPGWNLAFTNASVAQSTGHKLAQGSGFFFENFPGVPCSTPVTVTLTVGDTSSFAFKQGKAASTATVTVFNPSTFSFATQTVSQATEIKK